MGRQNAMHLALATRKKLRFVMPSQSIRVRGFRLVVFAWRLSIQRVSFSGCRLHVGHHELKIAKEGARLAGDVSRSIQANQEG